MAFSAHHQLGGGLGGGLGGELGGGLGVNDGHLQEHPRDPQPPSKVKDLDLVAPLHWRRQPEVRSTATPPSGRKRTLPTYLSCWLCAG